MHWALFITRPIFSPSVAMHNPANVKVPWQVRAWKKSGAAIQNNSYFFVPCPKPALWGAPLFDCKQGAFPVKWAALSTTRSSPSGSSSPLPAGPLPCHQCPPYSTMRTKPAFLMVSPCLSHIVLLPCIKQSSDTRMYMYTQMVYSRNTGLCMLVRPLTK